MSRMIIKYMDNSKNKRDITGATITVDNGFLKINEKHYIPICNVKEIVIEGSNSIK